MKAFLVLAIVGAVAAAPIDDKDAAKESLRTKKSPSGGYGGPSYGLSAGGLAYGAAPCAGAAPLAPVSLYALAPQAAGLAGPGLGPGHYRENEPKENEHKEVQARAEETARSYYAGPASSAGLGLAGGASAGLGLAGGAGGPAVGLFPSAKVGGCAVPLLLSCSPNVVSGHLAHAPAAYAGSAVGAYTAPAAIGAYAAPTAVAAVGLAPSSYRAPEANHKARNMETPNADFNAPEKSASDMTFTIQ